MGLSVASELDLGAATIIELGERIRRRELSPVELIEATNARIERLQPLLHSFVTHCGDYALERARQAEREIAANRYRGPLHGIPYTLKDVIATRGVRTTFGNPRGVDYRPPEQATLHRRLEEAGAILVGKVVSEIGRDTSGPVGCRNAWDPSRSPGTSSSGSGSATAASLGLLSIGTDTGGSVRHPGSNSSLVAMKPTFGRISRHGIWAASWSDDTAGPLTKTVEDNAAALEVIGAYDPLDPLSVNEAASDYRAGLGDSIAGVRIGVPADDWIWRDWLSEEEEEIVRAAIERLGELGAVLSEVRMPLAEHSRNRALGLSLASERPVFIRDHFSEEEIEAWTEIHAQIAAGEAQTFEQYLHTQQFRARITQEANAVLREVDVIAMPTGSTYGDAWDAETSVIRGREVSARSRGVYRNGVASVTGHPAISVPCGFGNGGRWPVGLMLHGRPLEEGLLYRVAHAYEQSADWRLRQPPL